MEQIIILAALSDNAVIGVDGKIPWKISGDMKRFKKITDGQVVVVGRKTYESLPSPKLPGRSIIVITSENRFDEDNAMFMSLQRASYYLPKIKGKSIFICGGELIYKEFLPIADRMELTHVHQTIPTSGCSGTALSETPGIARFPITDVNWDDWIIESKEQFEGFDFVTYGRIYPSNIPMNKPNIIH